MGRQKHLEFTSKRVAMLQHNGGSSPTFHWDGGCPGLGLRVTQAGARSFIYQGMFNGQSIRLTIGDISGWTVTQARSEARRLANSFDRGIDPRKVKAEQRAANERAGMRGVDLWPRYLVAHQGEWSDRHLQDNEWLARPGGVLLPLLERQLSDITAPVLVHWLTDAKAEHDGKLRQREDGKVKGARVQGRYTEVRQAFMRARAFFRWAASREELVGILDPRIFSHPDLRAIKPTAHARDDVLEKGQLEAWFTAVTQLSNPIISSYLQVLLLTGARRNELGALQWSDVDFQWKALWVHDKVEGEAGRKIPLTPYVKHLLSRLPRRNEWVFSSPTSESGRVVEPRIAHHRACDKAGIARVSIHGLRRSFSSLSEWVEMPVGIVAQIMGHKPSATAERHYKRRPLDLLALWHGKLEAWILEQAGVHFDEEAVETGLHVV